MIRPMPRRVRLTLPRDLADAGSSDARKARFVAAVLPVALHIRDQVLAERRALVGEIVYYSTHRQACVRQVRAVIEANRLYEFDGARLERAPGAKGYRWTVLTDADYFTPRNITFGP